MPFNKSQIFKGARSDTLAAVLGFLALFIFIALSNLYDWDHFMTTAEIDRRLWLDDFTLPTWTYQYCGGITRIGDPSAFGLSPVFIFPLLFGSFWGSKILTVFMAFLGFYFFRKLLVLISKWLGREGEGVEWAAGLLAMTYILGNHYVWHLHHGHITYGYHFFVLGLIYFCFKACVSTLEKRDYVVGNILVWALMSGGFYPSVIYFILPMLLVSLIFGMFLLPRVKFLLLNLGKWVALMLPGFLIGTYKWLPVVLYQKKFPRTIVDQVDETGSMFETILYQFAPTFKYAYFGKIVQHEVQAGITHGIWEFSSFSILNWLFVVLAILVLFRKIPKLNIDNRNRGLFLLFLLVLFVVYSLFCFGESLPFSPFVLLNQVLNNSIRVIGRFQIGISLCFALALWYLILSRGFEKHRMVLIFCFVFSLFNLLTFRSNTALPGEFLGVNHGPMQKMKLVTPPTDHQAFMYRSTMAGFGILNCSSPLERPRPLTKKFSLEEMAQEPVFFFVDVPEDSECARNSYFTQKEYFLHESCPKNREALRFNALKEEIDF